MPVEMQVASIVMYEIVSSKSESSYFTAFVLSYDFVY